jgi:pyruvate dehydrogenase E1 component alpha subunit
VAKGVALNEMMAEMFAKRTGSCKVMGGSMHLCDFSRGMLGAFGIVGAGIPIAAGAALSAVVRGTGQVAVSFFGDGATNEGIFHETLNMASLWKLPAVFVIENNQYALSMRVAESSALPNLAGRAAAYAMPGIQVDGNNVVEVYRAAQAAAERARTGGGPTLLECITYRIRGHARFEASGYRDPAEVEDWKQLDPITRLGDALQADGLATPTDLEQIQGEVRAELDAAIAFAEASPDAEATDYLQFITAEAAHA